MAKRVTHINKKTKVKERIIRFTVPNMVCAGCTGTIKSVLTHSEKVSPLRVTASWVTKEVYVVVAADRKETDAELLSSIKKELAQVDFTLQPAKSTRSYIIKGVVGLLSGFTLMMLMAFGVMMPPVAMALLALGSTALTFFLGWDTFKSAWKKFRKTKKLTMDAMYSVSAIAAIAFSFVALFVPGFIMMFDAALLIFGFRHLGIAVEQSIRRKIVSGVSFADRIKRDTLQETDGEIKTVAIEALRPGDVIRVRAGEYIPVNGTLLDEESSVYETIVNGQGGQPTAIRRGDRLRAGMSVPEHVDVMRIGVTARVEDSYLMQADKRLSDAQSKRAPIESTTDRVASIFGPSVFALAILSGIIIGCLFPPALAVQCMVATLVSACPCTIGFIVPLATYIGISKGREYGVEFKSGASLQAANRVNTVIFDLNGTLTKGKPIVSSIDLVRGAPLTRPVLMRMLCKLEAQAKEKHPIAKAIHDYAAKQQPAENDNDSETVEYDTQPYHSGVRAKVGADYYTVGNLEMMRRHGITVDSVDMAHDGAHQLIYIARGNQLIGTIKLTDPLRKDAVQVVQELKKMKKQIYICTGADLKTAQAYAKQLGINADHVYANCVPIDDAAASDEPNQQAKPLTKTEVISRLQAQGKKVAIVGDGANDGLAMTSCFGVAVRSPAADEVTEDNAAAVIQGNSLRPLVAMFKVAKLSMRNVKLSLAMSLVYNMSALLIASGLLVAVGFVLNPGIGAALMVIQAGLILAAAYFIKKKSLSIMPDRSPHHSSNVRLASTFAVKAKKSRVNLVQPEQCPQYVRKHVNLTCKPSLLAKPRKFKVDLRSTTATRPVSFTRAC